MEKSSLKVEFLSRTSSKASCKSEPTDPFVDPEEFVPSDQQIVYSGLIWKLKSDGDPLTAKCWDKRTMWLTSGGGLFYYSVEKQMPLGQRIAGMRVQLLGKMLEYYAFEVTSTGSSSARRRVFATDVEKDRDDWVKVFQQVQSQCRDDEDLGLSPMDLFKKSEGLKKRPLSRRRLSQGQVSFAADEVISPTSRSRVYGKRDPFENDQLERKIGRRKSQELWYMKNHSVLILDWDDTIFPTTWIRKDCDLNWKIPLHDQLDPGTERTEIVTTLLKAHAERAEQFLNQAAFFANVFIVTLAKRPWLDTSIGNFMPDLRDCIEAHGIPVIYAQDYVTEAKLAEERDKFKSQEDMQRFWTDVKAQAIANELSKFHERNCASWKNILSFGDSEFERKGTIAAGINYMRREIDNGRDIRPATSTLSEASQDTCARVMRVKTMKMLDDPTIEELMAQLTLLTLWLPCLVRRDGDINLEFPNSEDDNLLTELNTLITEETTRMSWSQFDGM